MLRQRNIKPEIVNTENNGFNGGVSIGGFDDHMAVTNEKFKTSNSSCNCWKYVALMLFLVAGASIGGIIYLTMLLKSHEQKLNIINNDLEGERAHKEGCLSELDGMESHMKSREEEKFQLEKEVSRLKRAVMKGGATDHPQQGQHHEKNHPPKPDPPTPHTPQHHDQLLRQQEEQQRLQQEEMQRKEEQELERQQEEQRRAQEENQRQEEQRRQHEEQLRRQQEEEQLRRQQEEEQLRRQQEEMRRQQEQEAQGHQEQ